MDNPDGSDNQVSHHGLFSMEASDNAEVVPESTHRGPEDLWSVSAKPDTPDNDEPVSEDWVRPHSARQPEPGGWIDAPTVPAPPRRDPPVQNVPTGPPPRYVPPEGESSVGQESAWDEAVEGEVVLDDLEVDEVAYAASSFGYDPEFGGFADGAAGAGRAHDGSFEEAEQVAGSDSFEQSSAHEDESGSSGRGVFDSVGSVFSAEPVDHHDDVIDEADDLLEEDWETAPHVEASRSLFSSGFTSQTHEDLSGPAGTARPFGATGTSRAFDDVWEHSGRVRDRPEAATSSFAESHQDSSDADEDAPGYEAAILRLHPQDRERASTALAVAGALLEPGERVLGIVTGQMLGRSAAVVVTVARVLIVNDRRWQPVVDTYRIGESLRVRGRHDHEIAALSFSDDSSLSMVDGIVEVELAMELASYIRGITGD